MNKDSIFWKKRQQHGKSLRITNKVEHALTRQEGLCESYHHCLLQYQICSY